MILHSAGHRLPVTSLCAPKGSFPCSDKEITSGLEIEEPVYARRNATESQRGHPRNHTQLLVINEEKKPENSREEEEVTFGMGKKLLWVLSYRTICPHSVQLHWEQSRNNHSLEGTSEFTPKAAGIPVGKSQPPRGANTLPRDEVAEVLQCHVPVQILPSRIWLAPLVLRRLLPHP